jgi:iron(III) transport system substrate-binding protein
MAHSRSYPRRAVLALALAATLATIGCAGPIAPTPAPTPGPGARLVIYASVDYVKAVAEAFERSTGTATTIVQQSGGPLLDRVRSEGTSPQWGVFWTDGAAGAASLNAEGLLVSDFRPAVSLTDLARESAPPATGCTPTGLTLAGVAVYDTRDLAAPPARWEDLLSPTWRGRIGMANPSLSGPAYTAMAGLMQQAGGEEAGKQFLTELKANGLRVYSKNKESLAALKSREITIAIVQSSAAIAAQAITPTLRIGFPTNTTLLPSCLGISAYAPDDVKASARRFAAFVLSPAGQRAMQEGAPGGDSYYWPVVQGVAPLPGLPALADLPHQTLNIRLWGSRERQLLQWFADRIAT